MPQMVLPFRAASRRATFHDLRGSAVVRLALAEATVSQFATFPGHSVRGVEAILDAHYLGRDVQLAEAPVLKARTENKTPNRSVNPRPIFALVK